MVGRRSLINNKMGRVVFIYDINLYLIKQITVPIEKNMYCYRVKYKTQLQNTKYYVCELNYVE
jgi:hypothetical protein